MSQGRHRSVCFSTWHWGVSVPGERTVFIVRSNLSLFPRGNYFKWLWQWLILPIFQNTKSLPSLPFPQAAPVSILWWFWSLDILCHSASITALSWLWLLMFPNLVLVSNFLSLPLFDQQTGSLTLQWQVEAFSNITNSLNNDCTSNNSAWLQC